MFDKIKNLFGKKNPKQEFSAEQYEQFNKLKEESLERVLGKMHDLVGHAIIPFFVGGAVDMYYFPNAIQGTGFATMELIEPDGSGPRPSRIGTYEFIAFTKYNISNEGAKALFENIELRLRGIFTTLGNYSYETVLNPLETIEIPSDEKGANHYVILDRYKKDNVDFVIGKKKYGLMLVIEVFKSEMEYAMKIGTTKVLQRLKEKGYYPYSDLDREPVF